MKHQFLQLPVSLLCLLDFFEFQCEVPLLTQCFLNLQVLALVRLRVSGPRVIFTKLITIILRQGCHVNKVY